MAVWLHGGVAWSQFTANSLAQLRSLGTTVNNGTVTLSPTGGDPHPVTGVVTPGTYWINGDHYTDPTNSHPIFMELGGSGNTYDLSGATIKLDTRELDGFGRNLGHDSGIDVVRISGSNNTVQGLTLIGEDIALDTDPGAQRYADWGVLYVELSGESNTLDGAHVVTRGSRTDTYGLGDAFGKGASQGIQPYAAHRKGSALRVGEATDAVINNVDLEVYTFGHGIYIQASEDTTITNSTVTGEVFSSQGVIDYPLYQEYGHTYWGNPIPEDIYISGAEGGVRMYTGASGLTVDNVVVTRMRTGFATTLGSGTITLNNVEAYGTESAFGFKSNTTITNAKGDAVNGPLFVVDKDNTGNSSIDVELVGDAPINHDYALVYMSGDNVDVSISSDLPAEYFEDTHLFRASQFFWDNWREADDFDVPDFPGYDLVNSAINNDTNMVLVLGEQATGNTGRSQGPVISNGKENYYDGVTWVPTGERLNVQHANGVGNSGVEPGATFDSNGTVVFDGGTLEIQPYVKVIDERVTITGDGVDGQGAIYSDGSPDNQTRLVNGGSATDELITLNGDASIGVGSSDGMLLVGRISGVGNLTKLGPGALSVERYTTFDGNIAIAEGQLIARTNVVRNGLNIQSGASFAGIGSNALNTSDETVVDGTLDLNARSDHNALSGTIGKLSGAGIVIASNASADSRNTLTIAFATGEALFSGQIQGDIDLIKSGLGVQSLGGSMSHTGATTVEEGVLLINGTHTGGDTYSVNSGGALGGNGTIDAEVLVNAGGVLAPGTSVGTLEISELTLAAGSTLALELGASGSDLLSAGSADLAGGVSISLLNEGAGVYLPGPSESFEVLDAQQSLTGSFANAMSSGDRVETTGGEGSFAVVYISSLRAIYLTSFQLAGDYNADGVVDAADYAVWRDANGATGLAPYSGADGDGDGQVTQSDYLVWQERYGTSISAAAAAVPEPAAIVALLSAGLLSAGRRT